MFLNEIYIYFITDNICNVFDLFKLPKRAAWQGKVNSGTFDVWFSFILWHNGDCWPGNININSIIYTFNRIMWLTWRGNNILARSIIDTQVIEDEQLINGEEGNWPENSAFRFSILFLASFLDFRIVQFI